MTTDFIPFGKPQLGEEEIRAVVDVLKSGTLVHGPVTHAFEKAFAERMGARHALAVASCTAGLHLSLMTSGVSEGDEVLVPAMTHVATAHAVEYVRARPAFVDVDPVTGTMDPALAAAAVTARTRAAMLVHFLGTPCDMDSFLALSSQKDFFLVEDCAIALDASYRGKKVGRFGRTGCFSFYPIKHMASIEGGMVITDDDTAARKIAAAKSFGYDKTVDQRVRQGQYDVTALGYNYRMSEVEAAVGLAQLHKLDAFHAARRQNAGALREALAGIDEIMIMGPPASSPGSPYCLNIVFPRDGRINRDQVAERLKAAGIGTSVHYPCAVPLFTYYREKYGYRRGQFPHAEWLAAQTISLPVGPHVKNGDPVRIARAVKEAISFSKN